MRTPILSEAPDETEIKHYCVVLTRLMINFNGCNVKFTFQYHGYVPNRIQPYLTRCQKWLSSAHAQPFHTTTVVLAICLCLKPTHHIGHYTPNEYTKRTCRSTSLQYSSEILHNTSTKSEINT